LFRPFSYLKPAAWATNIQGGRFMGESLLWKKPFTPKELGYESNQGEKFVSYFKKNAKLDFSNFYFFVGDKLSQANQTHSTGPFSLLELDWGEPEETCVRTKRVLGNLRDGFLKGLKISASRTLELQYALFSTCTI